MDLTDVSPESPSSIPSLRVVRPSMTSADSQTLTLASADEDFARMAKARLVQSKINCNCELCANENVYVEKEELCVRERGRKCNNSIFNVL